MWHQDHQSHYQQGDVPHGSRQIRPRPQQQQQQQQQQPHRHINPPPLMSINPVHPMTSAGAPSDCWEDLLDSGQLEVQLQQRLNVGAGGGPQFHKPPPQPHFQPQSASGYHYPPPNGPSRPAAISNQGNPMFTCPPPPINHQQGYPSGIRVQERPQQQQQLPQRMKILARPAPPRQPQPQPKPQPQPQPQMQEQPRNFCPVPLAPSQPESTPAGPQVQVQVAQGDNSLQTQYRPPDPVIKIMKRPTQEGPVENGDSAKPKPKTLKQREEEYAQARLRILGSAGTPEPSPPEEDDKEATAVNSVKMLSDGSSLPLAKNQPPQSGNSVERTPKGPDGSKGFQPGKK